MRVICFIGKVILAAALLYATTIAWHVIMIVLTGAL